jgi:hypothetical protein
MATVEPPDHAGGPPADASRKKHHNVWIWASIALAIAVVGLLAWGLEQAVGPR